MSRVQPAALPPGSRIAEYDIVRVLGAGGFGITYLAFDHQLDGPVALKEYFPAEVASRTDGSGVAATATTNQDLFAWGLDRFIQEARAIHRLRHPNVVRAYRYLEANSTAYIVLEYVEGEPLKTILGRRGRLSASEWRPWMNALLDGLAHVHAHGYLHRDIKPANIVVRSDNGEPVLIDFGSARLQHGDRTLTQVLTAGYAPIEQYTNDAAQGPQGDIYAMAAVSYRVLTGNTVPSAPDRMLNDGYEPLADRTAGTDSGWLAAIDRGLTIRPEDRPQTVEEWREELGTAEVEAVNTESLRSGATEQGEHGNVPTKGRSDRTGRPSAEANNAESPGTVEISARVSRGDDDSITITYLGASSVQERSKWPVVLSSVETLEAVCVVTAWGETVDDAVKDYNHSLPMIMKRARINTHLGGRVLTTPSGFSYRYFPIPRELIDWLYVLAHDRTYSLDFDSDSDGAWVKELRTLRAPNLLDLEPQNRLFALHALVVRAFRWPLVLSRSLLARLTATGQPPPSSDRKPDETHLIRGDHRSHVQRVQGTPTKIQRSSVFWYEIWHYGPNTVTLSTRTWRVLGWLNNDGQLKVSSGNATLSNEMTGR